MKPLPLVSNSPATQIRDADASRVGVGALPSTERPYSISNKRAGATCGVQRVYPWMLVASTAVAVGFCVAYINKPVIVEATQNSPTGTAAQAVPSPLPVGAEPAANPPIPSRKKPIASAAVIQPVPPTHQDYEETNVRMQHVLMAEASNGLASRVDLDVPVIYRSRNLRWTQAEVAEARALLAELTGYQEKSRLLRMEGGRLLEQWNDLVSRGLPMTELRADSPSLLQNHQIGDVPTGDDAGSSIQLQPSPQR